MSVFDALDESSERGLRAGRIYGVVIGVVTNNKDPDELGRVKLKFPWLSEADESEWARIAAPMAGSGRGFFFLPEVNDEVLVAFEHGDPHFPYVLGAMWNGRDAPPDTNRDGKNDVRMIKSRSGHTVRLNDEDGKGTIEIVDGSTNNSIVIDMSSNTITVRADKDITLSAAKGTIRLDAQSVEISSSGSTKLKAGGATNVEANGAMAIKGSTVDIN